MLVAGFTNPDMDMALVKELSEQAAAVRGGDMSRAEAMLTVQAHTLDFLFNSYVQSPSGGRLRNAPTRSSISAHKRDTWLLEIPLMPIALTRSSTERVETPPST